MKDKSCLAEGLQVKTEWIEGVQLCIPQQRDPVSGIWITLYTEVLKKPWYTPRGERIMLTCEDACRHADLQPGGCRDCGSCTHFHQAHGSQLGVCDHPARRRKAKTEEEPL